MRSLPPDFCRALVQGCVSLVKPAVLPSAFRPSSAATFGFAKLHAAPAVVPEFKECFHVLLPADFALPNAYPKEAVASSPRFLLELFDFAKVD